MLVNGPIRERLQLVDDYIRQLEQLQSRSLEDVRGDTAVAWSIEHGLQLAVQCVIDICQYMVAELSLGSPTSSPDAVEMLRDHGVFDATLAGTLVGMIRFRNIPVHAYAHVDTDKVYEILQTGLPDLRAFSEAVLACLSPPATHNS